jgi:AcrR family transcriptional regulator
MPTRATRAAKRPASRRKKSGTRAHKKDATRHRILDAALTLFEAKGYDKTTTKAIAKRAKIAEGTVFNYFETKDDIALYFFELEVDHAIDSVRASAPLRKAPLEERLFALVQFQLEYLQPYERFISAALVQGLRPESQLAFSARSVALRNRYLAFVRDLIDDALPDGRSNTLAWVAPQVFWIYYLGVILFWLHDTSTDKQRTLAFLDRSLALGVSVLRKGTI